MLLIELFFLNPSLFFMIVVSFMFTLGVHEYSHAQMAYSLGDPTAKDQGRLTINPLKHLDPFGTLMILIAGFGWGKPVPFNPHNLRNQKWGPALVGLAGPSSNFLMALVPGLALRFLDLSNVSLILFLSIFVWLNLVFGVFNLLPFPPLDGSHIFFTLFPSFEAVKILLFQNIFLSIIGAVLFMSLVAFSLICEPLFALITGMPLPF